MKRLLSIVLAMAICLSMGVTTFAAEIDSTVPSSEMTISEAAELLGVDESVLQGLEIKRLPSLGTNSTSRNIPTNLSSGVYYEDITVDSFTGAMHYINGSQFMYAAKLVSFEHSLPASFGIQLYFGDSSKAPYAINFLTETGEEYKSGWTHCNYGEGIYFKYYRLGYAPTNGVARIVIAVL